MIVGMVGRKTEGFFLLGDGSMLRDTGAFRGKKVSLDTIKSHGVVYR